MSRTFSNDTGKVMLLGDSVIIMDVTLFARTGNIRSLLPRFHFAILRTHSESARRAVIFVGIVATIIYRVADELLRNAFLVGTTELVVMTTNIVIRPA